MRRIYEAYAYGPEPLEHCLWNEGADAPWFPRVEDEVQTDIAVIGGGFTGLSAALHIAQAGEGVALLEAERLGWGASGRNGGFCCLGGGMLSNAALTRRFGAKGRQAFHDAEKAAIGLVADLLACHDIDAQTHSRGETLFAHRPRHWRALQAAVPELTRDYGVTPELIPQDALRQHGMNGPFHGALTLPIGFGLNPRRYLDGLSQAATQAGATLFERSPVQSITQTAGGYVLNTPRARVTARRLIIATNGYSSEDVPDWLRARYLPLQSNVLATRPLSADERAAQGWTTEQMGYDTRNLLHYFRLLPDGRFLFGMRGGVHATRRATARLRARIQADFHRMFPAWANVDIPHLWSGLVCLSRNATPFVGPIPEMPGAFAGLAYHGNGVAMGSFAGRLLADLARDRAPDVPYPEAFSVPPRVIPFGRHRRALLVAATAALGLADL